MREQLARIRAEDVPVTRTNIITGAFHSSRTVVGLTDLILFTPRILTQVDNYHPALSGGEDRVMIRFVVYHARVQTVVLLFCCVLVVLDGGGPLCLCCRQGQTDVGQRFDG